MFLKISGSVSPISKIVIIIDINFMRLFYRLQVMTNIKCFLQNQAHREHVINSIITFTIIFYSLDCFTQFFLQSECWANTAWQADKCYSLTIFPGLLWCIIQDKSGIPCLWLIPFSFFMLSYVNQVCTFHPSDRNEVALIWFNLRQGGWVECRRPKKLKLSDIKETADCLMFSTLAFKFTAAELNLYQRRFVSNSGKASHILLLSPRIIIRNVANFSTNKWQLGK